MKKILLFIVLCTLAITSCQKENLVDEINSVNPQDLEEPSNVGDQDLINQVNLEAKALAKTYETEKFPKDEEIQALIIPGDDNNCCNFSRSTVCCDTGDQACWSTSSTLIVVEVDELDYCSSPSATICQGSFIRGRLSNIPSGWSVRVDGYLNWTTSTGSSIWFNIPLPPNGGPLGIRVYVNGNGCSGPDPTVTFKLFKDYSQQNIYNIIGTPNSTSFKVIG